MARVNDAGPSLEGFVQFVYGQLLNAKGEGVSVECNVRMIGKSGATHEIDVFYEFVRAGVTHRVAVECKDKRRPVEKGEVQEFFAKLHDIGGLTGVLVSASGYQEGAITFAKGFNILTLAVEELPNIPRLISMRLEIMLPDEACLGEPFWTLMEIRNGRVTGNYDNWARPGSEYPIVPLFFARSHAAAALELPNRGDRNLVVRGVGRFMLRSLLIMSSLQNTHFMINFEGPSETGAFGRLVGCRDLAIEFLDLDVDAIIGREGNV